MTSNKKLGARIVPFAGWEMPIQYAASSKSTAPSARPPGLFDVSHMGGSSSGSSTPQPSSTTSSRARQPRSRTGGRSIHAPAKEAGTNLDDLIVYRLARDAFLIVCNGGNRDKSSAHLRKAARTTASSKTARTRSPSWPCRAREPSKY